MTAMSRAGARRRAGRLERKADAAMFDRFLTLDEFVTPDLLRPFYLAAIGIVAFSGVVGALGGLAGMTVSFLGGLVTAILSLAGAAIGILAIRMAFEAFIALMRLHARFVGGHPRDRIPD
jgi:hypothetical protein